MAAQMIESDGLRIATESVGSGKPIAFVHGLTGARAGVLEQFADLRTGYRLITFDQRGHGDSTPVTDPELYDPRRMAGDMRTVLQSMGVEKAIIGGESMGAATSVVFAMQWPEMVEALLLTAPAFGPEPNADRENIWNMGDIIEKQGVEAYVAHAKGSDRYGLPESVLQTVRARLMAHDQKSVGLACKTVIDWVIMNDIAELGSLDMPTCILAWKDDPLHPYELAEQMASVIPRATLVTHSIQTQFDDPANTGRIYQEYLGRL